MEQEVKIEKVTIKNCKNINSFIAVFGGKSAHVSGENGIGKSTLIRALTDRLAGLRPSIVTKTNEKEGFYEMSLTDGSKFLWEFNSKGGEKLTYRTQDGKRISGSVFTAIKQRYFARQFDINQFLTTSEPAKRLKIISELIGINLDDVRRNYKIAYDNRKEVKRILRNAEAQIPVQPFYAENLEIAEKETKLKKVANELNSKLKNLELQEQNERTRLNAIYTENQNKNREINRKAEAEYQKALDIWNKEEEERENDIDMFNGMQLNFQESINTAKEVCSNISINTKKMQMFAEFVDFEGMNKVIDAMIVPKELKTFEPTIRPLYVAPKTADPKPSDENLNNILALKTECNAEIEQQKELNTLINSEVAEEQGKKIAYETLLKSYNNAKSGLIDKVNNVKEAEKSVELANDKIKAIVSSAKLPKEFSIDLTDKYDILYNGFAITAEQLASSAIYISAFKLAAYNLNEFKVIHFDVSFLDYKNRIEVRNEAEKMGIQLLTESAATEEGQPMELNYIITEK